MIPERYKLQHSGFVGMLTSGSTDSNGFVELLVIKLMGELGAAEANVERMTAFLEAFVVAYNEPVEGPWFKLRAFAESQGIYADDLGRDRILLRIAQAALNGPVSK